MKDKHERKKILLKQVQETRKRLKEKLGFFTYWSLIYRINNQIAFKKKKWSETHQKKLQRLRLVHSNISQSPLELRRENTHSVHNFSGYILSDDEIRVLSRTLDHYVPVVNKRSKREQVEFERFYVEILANATNLDAEQKLVLKTSFLNAFNGYSKVKVNSNEDKNIIERLYRNDKIVILRQDKGRGVVILNKTDYIKKCEDFLHGAEFEMLNEDPTSSFQTSVQTTLRKMKKKLSKSVYSRLYPSASQPGLFFGLAKIHKLREGETDVKELPLRPVISKIGTTTYQISKHLASLLTPLTKSKHNIESTKDFINKLKTMKISNGYKMVSLDVVSLFTSVPLDYTINIILDKVFKEKMVKTKLSRSQLKTLLELCTKEMHFTFNSKVYRQKNGVAMGSPLGPVLANIFMVHLEQMMIPRLAGQMSSWYRYVDDTFTFIKEDDIDSVREALNGFHPDIKFTYEAEMDRKIAFLDVLITRKVDGTFDTEVYRKKTDNSIYINWNAYATRSWKLGTLKGLFRRAFLVCSTDQARNKEISFLKHAFTKINGYPSRIVNKTLHEVKRTVENEARLAQPIPVSVHSDSSNPTSPVQSIPQARQQNSNATNPVEPYICLPYKGIEGENVLKKFKQVLRSILPNEVKPRFIYKGTKLGSFFSVKDKVQDIHQTNLVYGYVPQGESDLSKGYIGETHVRFGRRTKEHARWDKKSSVYKNSEAKNIQVVHEDFSILERGYPKYFDRKIAEALYIKDYNPVLNGQQDSYRLKLFN